MGRKIIQNPKQIKIDGVDFTWAEIESSELSSKERFFVANRKGIALEILLIYQNEEQLQTLLGSLQTMKFQ